MAEKNINEFKTGESMQGFFLVKESLCKISSNNKKYLDIYLADKSGEINAKLWDCTNEQELSFGQGIIVKVKGTITLWQGKSQLNIEKIRVAKEEDNLTMSDFIPTAPYEADVMLDELYSFIEKIHNEDMRQIVAKIIEETKEKLLIQPAAMKNHHNVRAGLLYHIVTMLKVGESLSSIYPLVNKDLLLAGIILHDISKIDEMESNEIGLISDYTFEGQLLGHIIQGIKRIERVARELGADNEISILLQHMVLSYHYEPEFGSPKRPMIPEAEILHYIDMIDARMFDMEKVLSNTNAQEFSEKVWVLHNRKLYKASAT
jgi:3'-5' exoribonuclease